VRVNENLDVITSSVSAMISELASDPHSGMDALIYSAVKSPLTSEQIALLAETLASSGERLSKRADSADVASTGGPGSLTTLLTSCMLASSGAFAPKIAVPGRPAGGIDSLGSLPGFRLELDARAAAGVLDACGQVHLSAGTRWTPLDLKLFRRRQELKAQGVPCLVAASLLAKKVAAGVSSAAIDIRASAFGNFGTTRPEAETNSQMLVDAGRRLGIAVSTHVSDGERPRQPWIGRGEALTAVAHILQGRPSDWLRAHEKECWTLSEAALGSEISHDLSAALTAFEACLVSQGATVQDWYARAAEVEACDRWPILAGATGTARFDMAGIRSAVVAAQERQPPAHGASFSDPCGLLLVVLPGAEVSQGDVLALYRPAKDEVAVPHSLSGAFSVKPPCAS
jgi:thymidine phosphorylase